MVLKCCVGHVRSRVSVNVRVVCVYKCFVCVFVYSDQFYVCSCS